MAARDDEDFLDDEAADPVRRCPPSFFHADSASAQTDTAFIDELDGEVVADLGSDDQQPASDSDMDEAAASEPPVLDECAQCLQAHSEPVRLLPGGRHGR